MNRYRTSAKLRVQTRAELIKLHQRLHTTTIYVTHDQTEAMTMGNRIAVMKDGVLQQLDTPQVLYDHPANQFVAGFIGSPAMNFFTAELGSADGAMTVRLAGTTFQLPPAKAASLQRYGERDVTVGIRPENISKPSSNSSWTAEALVEVVEPLGSDVFVTYRTGEESFVARQPPHHQSHVGDREVVALDLSKAHFFNSAAEEAVA
jgi:multiple sugar transport system ATP-binding protein